ncbi:helix-turn-helix domain-containing protein [Pseudomonas sp. UFMG81]|uniref:helix-turn-helix domain-containing protein n=1 Tax=Pseudomonas sp. UFMG81 TaxID=2745936 RepID=UPI001E34F6BB|nr:helix-turn-helix domain-containing protein [Pseudomonas sp. UFMG81]
MSPLPFHSTHPPAATRAGEHLRRLRHHAGLSQLDLALLAGVSQRHLSCVETGRAKASPSTLHALLSALDVPLEHCNAVFLAAGYAPRYGACAPDAPAMQMVHAAVEHILHANNPAPAIVIDSNWDITAANVSTGLLFAMAGVPAAREKGLNLLDTLLRPGGLGDHLVNADEIRAIAWQRAAREALGNADLARRLQGLPAPPALEPDTPLSPVVLTRVRVGEGELRFLSTFTTFGMPLDITVASLRIEHLVPADSPTWRAMTTAYDAWHRDAAPPGNGTGCAGDRGQARSHRGQVK